MAPVSDTLGVWVYTSIMFIFFTKLDKYFVGLYRVIFKFVICKHSFKNFIKYFFKSGFLE